MRLILPAVVLALAGVAPPALAQSEERGVPVDMAPYHLPIFTNEFVTVAQDRDPAAT